MIKVWQITIPELSGEQERRVYLYLPESYGKDSSTRYPVLYMFDGHNVFFDSHATFGKSWGMKEYLEEQGKGLIVVAIECNPEGDQRLSEYAPFDFEIPGYGSFKGRGEIYMNWLVNTLKPYIDEHYRTLPDRENTVIAGSSMGGLMSLFAAARYSDIFQRAACLSPSLWVDAEKSLDMIRNDPIPGNSVIYMDYGSEELERHLGNPEVLGKAVQQLLNCGVKLTFRIVPGGTHCEASWERQIPIFMDILEIF